jgi:hypothetical protein
MKSWFLSLLSKWINLYRYNMGAHFSPCGRLLAACVACVPQDAETPVPGGAVQVDVKPLSQVRSSLLTLSSIQACQVRHKIQFILSLKAPSFIPRET